jgi:hypothetical protein
VFALAAVVGVLLLVTSGRYGYMGDELYFIEAGRHLSWAYFDQPALVPLLANALDALAPGSLVVLRLPATLATAAAVVVAALTAREMGGGPTAQLLTAGAAAVRNLYVGHTLSTPAFDLLLWFVLVWLLVRWVRTRADGLLVWAGVVTAVAVNVKLLVPTLWLVVVVGVLAFGPRELLGRPLLWLGALIAAVGAAPPILWQAAHGWPQLDMSAAIAAEMNETWGGRPMFLPQLFLTAGIIVGLVLLCYGLWQLVRSPELRPYRFLGWATVSLILLVLAQNGRPNYCAGMFAVCWAAAAISIERGVAARWWRWLATWPVYLLSGVLAVFASLPVAPVSWLSAPKPYVYFVAPPLAPAEIGWPQVAQSVAGIYRQLPDRAHTAILTGSYMDAAALAYYGPPLGLPKPYSGSRGYSALATPPETARDVLFVGHDSRLLTGHFANIRQVGVLDLGAGAHGISQGAQVWLATGRTEPWSVLWPKLRDLSVHPIWPANRR